MRIEFRPLEGNPKAATLPYPECRHIIVKGDCPTCTGWEVLISHDIRETAIFKEKDRELAIKHLQNRGADSWEEVAPQLPGEWKIMGIDGVLGEFTGEAKAVCLRCRTHVGRIHTTFDTVFGRTEDQLITSGLYGIVIGAE